MLVPVSWSIQQVVSRKEPTCPPRTCSTVSSFGPGYIAREIERTALAILEDDLALQSKVSSEWRTHLDSMDPRLAEYLRDAMLAYANTRMS